MRSESEAYLAAQFADYYVRALSPTSRINSPLAQNYAAHQAQLALLDEREDTSFTLRIANLVTTHRAITQRAQSYPFNALTFVGASTVARDAHMTKIATSYIDDGHLTVIELRSFQRNADNTLAVKHLFKGNYAISITRTLSHTEQAKLKHIIQDKLGTPVDDEFKSKEKQVLLYNRQGAYKYFFQPFPSVQEIQQSGTFPQLVSASLTHEQLTRIQQNVDLLDLSVPLYPAKDPLPHIA